MLKNYKKIPSVFIVSLVLLISIGGCINDDNSTSADSNLDLMETIDSYDELTTFSNYADSLNLYSRLSESDTYTFFVPTNDAFSELSDGVLDTLSEEQLEEVLAYHIADTTLFSQQLNRRQQLRSLQGEILFVAVEVNSISVNDGVLVGGDIQATNGVLHAVNTVLFPDAYLDVSRIIAKRYDLSTMESAIGSAELADTLSENTENGFTVFAPSNSAFEGVSPPDNQEALEDTIRYHIIPQKFRADDFESSQMLESLNGQELKVEVNDTTITVNDSVTVTLSDIEGTNGVVHIIDTFLTSPSEE